MSDMDLYQQYIHISRYSRWIEELGRRETWEETVDRYINFFDKHTNGEFTTTLKDFVKPKIINLEDMPSMRCLMSAGLALERENIASYNCSYIAINTKRSFAEALYVLMCGTGVGFSCERQEIANLPLVPKNLEETDDTIVVADSKMGWAKAYHALLNFLWNGNIPRIDYNRVRPAGARLKVFGGRASGPAPLKRLFDFTVESFKRARGRKLNSLEVHDLMCMIGEIVVVGGVRRCLPSDTPVFTPNGPKAIKDISVGDIIVTGGKEGRVIASGSSGVKQTIIINHRFGKLECTPDHMVAVFNSIMGYGFKKASEVVEGDRLVWDSVGYEGSDTYLDNKVEDLHFNSNKFDIPKRVNSDLAWLIGYVHGDGHISSSGIEISGNMKEMHILLNAQEVIKKYFGLGSSCGSDGRSGNGARLRCHSAPLARWFKENVKIANESLNVPAWIFSSTPDVRFAYVSGLLDADGRIRKDTSIDIACTIYPKFAEQIVTLLAGLGMAAVVQRIDHTNRRNGGENAKDAYNISLPGTTNRCLFNNGAIKCLKLKARPLSLSGGSVDFSFPISWAGTNQGYKAKGNINVSAMRYDLPLLPTRVTSVYVGRMVETCDIQVEGLEQFTANGVVVHNSALISLSNLSDQRMRDAKSGQWWTDNPQRALANNSVAYTEKPDAEIFMEEWLSLVKSKSGERGIFNREAAARQATKWGRREEGVAWGVNPCCHAGGERLLTDKGYKTFAELSGKTVNIVSNDGSITEGSVWSTGVKPVVTVNFESGLGRKPITCTADHIYMLTDGSECQAGDLSGKQPMPYIAFADVRDKEEVLAGFMLGDAALNRLNSDKHKGVEVYFSKKDGDIASMLGVDKNTMRWYSKYAADVARKYGLRAAKIGTRGFGNDPVLLQGLYSANGSVINGHRVALKSIDLVQLEEVASVMLEHYGIESYITTNKAKKVKFSNGEYLCKESYDLNISRYDSILAFAEHIGFVQEYKRSNLHKLLLKRAPTVRSIKPAGEVEVFDFTEPKNHWGVVENCVVHNSEIILKDKQFCNLSEVVVRESDTLDTLKEKVEVATILGTFQATLTDFSFVSEVWARNTAEEALLGVSLTGIMDNKLMSGAEGTDSLVLALNELRDHARSVNAEWANKLGIKPSAAITCVKPSGTVSQLCNTASGIHARHNQNYIRTVRLDKKDPLYEFMLDRGFHIEDDVMRSDSTAVVSFPISAPESSVVRSDITAIDALELWLIYQREWCEHKPSITVTVKDDEWLEVGAWVYKHFDEVSGISFLPHTDHTYQQAPYQDMTTEEFEQWKKDHPLPEVDWRELAEYEKEDNTVSMQTLACTGGSCEI